MTTDAQNLEPPVSPVRSWVWRCNDASISAGQMSVFAVVETLAAVAVYWYLVWRFNWPWMMFISMFAAPMLLLRSEQSVVLGLRWLKTYVNQDGKSYTLFATPIFKGGVIIVTGLICYWLAQHWLLGYTGWSLFGRAAVLGAGVFLAMCSVVGAVVYGVVMSAFLPAMLSDLVGNESALIGAFVRVLSGAFVGTFVGAGVVAIAGVAVGAIAGIGAFYLAGTMGRAFAGLMIGYFVASGVVGRTLLIRLLATLRHPIAGLKQLPQN